MFLNLATEVNQIFILAITNLAFPLNLARKRVHAPPVLSLLEDDGSGLGRRQQPRYDTITYTHARVHGRKFVYLSGQVRWGGVSGG